MLSYGGAVSHLSALGTPFPCGDAPFDRVRVLYPRTLERWDLLFSLSFRIIEEVFLSCPLHMSFSI